MRFTLSEVDHLIKALDTMSTYDVARARELIDNGVTDHNALISKLKMYRYRITWEQNN
jgi:hypothetical protein